MVVSSSGGNKGGIGVKSTVSGAPRDTLPKIGVATRAAEAPSVAAAAAAAESLDLMERCAECTREVMPLTRPEPEPRPGVERKGVLPPGTAADVAGRTGGAGAGAAAAGAGSVAAAGAAAAEVPKAVVAEAPPKPGGALRGLEAETGDTETLGT